MIFGVTWGVVNRAIRWVVEYGLVHRDLGGVTAIGVDEIAVWKGHKYLTVVYQIDQGSRRLVWVGKDREAIITDMYAKGVQGMKAEDPVRWAEGKLRKIYES